MPTTALHQPLFPNFHLSKFNKTNVNQFINLFSGLEKSKNFKIKNGLFLSKSDFLFYFFNSYYFRIL